MKLLTVVAAAAIYALMSAVMKEASSTGDASVALVARYVFACATLVPIYLASGRPTVRTTQLRWHLLRGGLGFGMFLCYTLALERLPLQNAMVLNSSYLLFVPILMLVFMRQRVGPVAVAGLVLGFAGIVVVTGVRPDGLLDWGSAFALASGVASAGANVIVARLRRTDSSFSVVFYFFGISLALSVGWALITSRSLALGNWWLIIAVGALSAVYQQLLAYALKHLSGELVSSVMASAMIFGFGLDMLMFQHFPSPRDYGGSVLILAGALVVLWAAHRRSRHTRLPELPSPPQPTDLAPSDRTAGVKRAGG
ncbi:DMT family transporter [Streptomyces cucumeris]|uniref:DMT family transporter n=1 Tax=Streptomyces cucumeris TaxID=2962890 RepID=UPI003D74845E